LKRDQKKSSGGAALQSPQMTAHTPELFPGNQKTYTAHIDGGARGNPGPAGYGVFVTDGAGKAVAELSEYLGKCTNNVAEYSALVAALEWAVEHGAGELNVVSDSELLVKQMLGQYKVANADLKQLYMKAQQLKRRLSGFKIRHVLRGQNKDADRLANAAMDRGMGKSAASAENVSPATKTVRGIVKHGVVEFLGAELPEGTLVEVRPAGKSGR